MSQEQPHFSKKRRSQQEDVIDQIQKAAEKEQKEGKYSYVSKKRLMENFGTSSPERKKEFVILTPDRWSQNGWRYVTVHDKPTAYFAHPFKKNSTGYTNQNMTSTYDGRVRADHFKSTYESFFNEELEELRKELSPQPRIVAGKSYASGFGNFSPRNHKRGQSTDFTPPKLSSKEKMSKLQEAGSMHLNHNKLTKQYQVTMNNDGIPLRELTLGGMLGQKTVDQNFDVWAGSPVMRGRGVSEVRPFNRKKTFMTRWEHASFNGGVFSG